jgi:hypothetical protein
MNSSQTKILIGIITAVILCWAGAPYWGGVGRAALPVSQEPLLFSAEQAFQTTREFVTQNPRRVLGSIEARQATGYLRAYLKRLGYQVEPPSYFEAMIAGRRQVGSNVVAIRASTLPATLTLIAHYDTARTTLQGAMDDGSGVGVMLELARVFAGSPLRHNLMIVASDGEEWGMLGAADVAQNHPERRRIAGVLSLDWVAIGDLTELRLDTEGQRSGYAPAWLRRIAFQSAAAQGLPVVSPHGFLEDVQRALAFSTTDQGPFLHLGIPAINLGSGSADEARVRQVYHSQDDTIANLRPASMLQYGRAAERILRSMDEFAAVPPGMKDAFRWGNDTFISGWAMSILQYLTFLPFFAMLGIAWMRYGQSVTAGKILREVTFISAWLVPFVLTYSLILFCRLMRLLPINSLYPGPLKDPMLENPAWGVVAGIFGSAAAAGIGLHFLARHLTRGQPHSFGASKTMLMSALLVVVMLALQYNPYWAVTFLAFPALIWGSVGRWPSAAGRVVGALAIPAAGCVLYAVAVYSGHDLGVGWDILWYAVLGINSGMLQWQGLLLAALAIVLGLRFLSLQFSPLRES